MAFEDIKIEFIGKCLLVSSGEERVLVIGDLHLGYEESLRRGGLMLPLKIMERVKGDLKRVFESVGKVNKVVVLGDLKHVFGGISMDDRKEIGEVMNFLRDWCEEVIVIKGNHDKSTSFLIGDLEGVKFVDYYLWESFKEEKKIAFLHGDRNFEEIYEEGIEMWVVGHAHPAIVLEEIKGSKKEKYKCFLDGKFEERRVIIVPSFFDVNEGTDVLSEFGVRGLGLAWNFDLGEFVVKIVQDKGLDVYNFGKLKKLR